MKFVVFFALLCVGISVVAAADPHDITFGDTVNTRPIHAESVVVESSVLQTKTRSIGYRTVSLGMIAEMT